MSRLPRRTVATCASIGALLIATAVAVSAAALLGNGAEPIWLMALSVGVVVVRIAWQDMADLTIPDDAIVALAVLGAGFRLADDASIGEPLAGAALAMALDVVLCGGLLLGVREVFFRRRGYEGLGFGDVKLAAAGGALAGTSGFAWALLAASLAGIAVALFRGTRSFRVGAAGSAEKLPFGALLAPALWVAWLIEQTPRMSGVGG